MKNPAKNLNAQLKNLIAGGSIVEVCPFDLFAGDKMISSFVPSFVANCVKPKNMQNTMLCIKEPCRHSDLKSILDRNKAIWGAILYQTDSDCVAEEVISYSEQCKIPLMKANCSFPLRNLAIESINCEQSVVYQDLECVMHYIVENNASLKFLLGVYSIFEGHFVAFIDSCKRKIVYAPTGSVFSEKIHTIPLQLLLENYRNVEMFVGGQSLGYIVFDDIQSVSTRPLTVQEHHFLNAITTFHLLKSLHQKPHEAFISAAIKDIVDGNCREDESSKQKLKSLKINIDGAVVVLYIRKKTNDKDSDIGFSKQVLISTLSTFYDEVHVVKYNSDYIVVCIVDIVNESAAIMKNTKQTLSLLFESKDNTKSDVNVGVGTFKRGIFSLNETFAEAKMASNYSFGDHNESKVYFWEEMGVKRIFALIANDAKIRRYALLLIEPVLDLAMEGNRDLWDTLVCLEETSWDLAKTSKQLHVHYNTVKYRKEKLLSMLDIDFENSMSRIALSCSVQIFKGSNLDDHAKTKSEAKNG